MSKVYETLKKKNDTSVEVYPNIERTNIPDGAINTAKIEDKAVNYNKLNDALQDDITHLRNIYDAEDDKLSVSDIELTDDLRCTNVYASNNVYVTDSVNADNVRSNAYYDAQNDELKVIVNHCIQAKLVNRNDISDERWIFMFFVSSTKTSITTFSELLSELNKRINMTILDNANNTLGWVEAVDINNGYASLYVSDGNGDVESVEFNSAITIQDAVYPI